MARLTEVQVELKSALRYLKVIPGLDVHSMMQQIAQFQQLRL